MLLQWSIFCQSGEILLDLVTMSTKQLNFVHFRPQLTECIEFRVVGVDQRLSRDSQIRKPVAPLLDDVVVSVVSEPDQGL